MRVNSIIVIMLWLLCLNACPKDPVEERQPQPESSVAPTVTSETDNASDDSASAPQSENPGKRIVKAISPDGRKIAVHRLKSGNTPYRGMYCELDEWIWDNYDPGEEDLAHHGKGIESGQTLRALYVTEDGYVIPNIEALSFDLDRRKEGEPTGAKPGPYALYSIGELPDRIRDANFHERAILTAEYMPPIPLWLSAKPPLWALLLPDGSVVFKGKQGEGKTFFPDSNNLHLLDDMKVSHYDSRGMFIQQSEPGQLWCELFFPDFEEALKRHGIKRDNVREYGLYVQFANLMSKSKTGYYYYDGTPLTIDEIMSKPDYSNLFVMYGKHIPAMYIRQHEIER